ncbi:MAG: tetratricopeptide repeat protein, partial [Bradymonadaceae bacterium]
MKIRYSFYFVVLCFLFPFPQVAFADDAQSLLEEARGQYKSGHWDQAVSSFEKAYKAADEGSVGKAEAALEWGSLLWEQGDYGQAEARVKDALERARALKLDHAIGQLLLTLGHIEASQGRLREAESTLTICVRMAGEEQDRTYQALCRLNRRHVRTLRGQPPGSEAEFRADIAALEQAGTPLSVGTSLAKTAELFQTTGDLGRAMELLERADKHFAGAGSVPAIARNKLRIAQLMQEQGRWSDARGQLDGLVGQFEVMGSRPLLVNALGSTARD